MDTLLSAYSYVKWLLQSDRTTEQYLCATSLHETSNNQEDMDNLERNADLW